MSVTLGAYLANAQKLLDNGNISRDVFDSMLRDCGKFCESAHEYVGYADVYKLQENGKWDEPTKITLENYTPERMISMVEQYVKKSDALDVFVTLDIHEDDEYYGTYTFRKEEV